MGIQRASFLLSECQQRAQEGLLATAMGSYISWIARDYEGLQDRLRRRADELRASVFHQASAAHARLPGILAELQAGFEVWLEFAVEAGAIEQSEQVQLKQRCRKALEETAAVQGSYHRASDPAFQFLSLLRSALAAGQAHIADRHGMAPESADRWGWRPKPTGRGWLPQGSRIGWLAGGDVFLESGASYRAAQELAGSESLPISALTLHRRLRQRGLLAGVDAGRQMLLVRRVLEGCSREVLHIKQSDLAKL